KRFIVHKSLYNEFVSRFTEEVKKMKCGDPLDESTEIGTLARVDLAEDIEKQVDKSVKMGARIVTGGKRKDAFYEPTVLVDVTTDMPVFNEEVFGPVAPVVAFGTFEEA